MPPVQLYSCPRAPLGVTVAPLPQTPAALPCFGSCVGFAMSLRRVAGPLSRALAACAPEAPVLSGGASVARRWFASKGASADAETVGACSRVALRGGGVTPQLPRTLCTGGMWTHGRLRPTRPQTRGARLRACAATASRRASTAP